VSGSGISWAICKSAPCSRQTTTPAPHHSFFTGRMPFLPPNQQCQSTEGIALKTIPPHIKYVTTVPCNLLSIITLVWHCQPFSDINVPQGSAAMPMRYGGIFNKCCAANLVENLTVKYFWRSVKNLKIYHPDFVVSVFFATECLPYNALKKFNQYKC